jgi:NAD(P)-dependent dehydrogenase (short-subunit alcohol dehydrogenase family)
MVGSPRDRVVVVTGASAGVGRATARAFGSAGAKVALLARNEPALEAAADEVRQRGGEPLVCRLDVADAEAVERAAAAVEGRFGRIDTWVNNAMATVFAPALDITPEEYRRVTEVTYLGYVYGTLAAVRRMQPRGEGTVIQVGSALVYRSIPLQSAYCAAKAAVRGFTDSLRCELIHQRSRVQLCMIQLPAVNTPQPIVQRNKMRRQAQPVPPMYAPELIADAIVYLAEHPRRELVVGGSSLKAILGQKLIPGLLDRYLGKNGWEAQFVDAPNDPARPDCLFEHVPGDHGAHGPYRDQERRRSLQLWATTHRGVVAGVVGALALSGLARLAAPRS